MLTGCGYGGLNIHGHAKSLVSAGLIPFLWVNEKLSKHNALICAQERHDLCVRSPSKMVPLTPMAAAVDPVFLTCTVPSLFPRVHWLLYERE